VQPDRGAFVGRDQPNNGTRRDQFILDATGATRTRSSARRSRPASSRRARVVPDQSTLGATVAAEYLHDVQTKFYSVMAKSNLYKGLDALVADDTGPGTGVLWLERGREDARPRHPLPGRQLPALDERARPRGHALPQASR
jgi:hypothetical protein